MAGSSIRVFKKEKKKKLGFVAVPQVWWLGDTCVDWPGWFLLWDMVMVMVIRLWLSYNRLVVLRSGFFHF